MSTEDTDMSDAPSTSDISGDAGTEPGRGSVPRTPRWVKVIGIIAAAVVLLVLILLLIGGRHGPGRHLGSADAGAGALPSIVLERGEHR